VSIPTETLVEGVGFPEGARWHAGRLWFSDFHHRKVRSIGPSADLRVELHLDDVPSGLGWDLAGNLLVVSMTRRQLLRVGQRVEVLADLSSWTAFGANDMAVDSRGRAYVGNFGYDFVNGEEPRPTMLVLVDEHGHAAPVTASELLCPNGIVIDEPRRRIVVAETFAHRLSAYDLRDDGSLGERETFAVFDEDVEPDGIAIDDEGEVWVATCSPAVLRVARGGRITGRVVLSSGLKSFAVAIGGHDGTTLFVCSAPGIEAIDPGRGRVEVAALSSGS
jgi:sugar lactone lactonase YvrE